MPTLLTFEKYYQNISELTDRR